MAADIRKMVQELGDLTAALEEPDGNDMAALYEVLGLQMSYNHESRSAEVAISLTLPGILVAAA